MRGGIHQGDPRFRPRFVGIVDVWNYFLSGDWILSCPGDAGSTNPGLDFPRRAGRHRPGGLPCSSPVCWSCENIGISDPGMGYYPPQMSLDLNWGFDTMRGGIDLEKNRVRPRFVGVVDLWNYL